MTMVQSRRTPWHHRAITALPEQGAEPLSRQGSLVGTLRFGLTNIYLCSGRWRRITSPRSSVHPLGNPIRDPQRIGNDGERRVHRADRRKEARIGDVQVVELMRLAIDVEHRRLRIRTEPRRAGLVRGTADRDVLAE